MSAYHIWLEHAEQGAESPEPGFISNSGTWTPQSIAVTPMTSVSLLSATEFILQDALLVAILLEEMGMGVEIMMVLEARR